MLKAGSTGMLVAEMLRDAGCAGMLRLGVEGCSCLAVQGCLWYRDAQTCRAGRLMAWGCDFSG